MDLAGWLRNLGLEQYEPAFRDNEIDDTVMPSLTADDLKDLGVGIVGHRRKLLDAIAALRAAKAPPPEAAPPATKAARDTAERRQLTVMFCDPVDHAIDPARSGGSDPLFFTRRKQLIELASRHRVPAIYPLRAFADEGGLMSYASTVADENRQAGIYVGTVLNGSKPSDLPIHQSTKLELMINLKAAKALALTVPASLLTRADEVIE